MDVVALAHGPASDHHDIWNCKHSKCIPFIANLCIPIFFVSPSLAMEERENSN